MAPWIGFFGNVLLGLLPGFLILRIGEDELLGLLRFVADDKACVGQGHAALGPRIGAKSVPANLVGRWRVAGSGAPWRHRCI